RSGNSRPTASRPRKTPAALPVLPARKAGSRRWRRQEGGGRKVSWLCLHGDHFAARIDEIGARAGHQLAYLEALADLHAVAGEARDHDVADFGAAPVRLD